MKRQLTTLCIVSSLLLVLAYIDFPVAAASETLLASYSTTSADLSLSRLHPSGDANYASALGESFSFSDSYYSITKAEFYISKQGAIGNLTAQLYAMAGNVPTGAPLAIAEELNASTFSVAYTWVPFTFNSSNQYRMSSSVSYGITTITTAGTWDSSHRLDLRAIYSDGYADGRWFRYDDSGWESPADYDVAFRVYGEEDPLYTSVFYPTSEGNVYSGWIASYATAWSTPTNTHTKIDIGQSYLAGPEYRIMRSMLRFDTSLLPDRATLLSAKLGLYGELDHAETVFNIEIYNWTGGPAITTDDWTANDTTTGYGNFNSAAWNVGSYNNITFTSLTIVSKTSFTDLFLRSMDDTWYSTPTTKEWVRAKLSSEGMEFSPKLYVSYFREDNEAPVLGEFQPLSSTQYNEESFLLNVTVYDADGIADLYQAYIELNGSIILKWERSTTFTVYSDPSSYVTLHSGSKTEVNASAYRLSWNITIGNNYEEGLIDAIVDNTIVFDEIANSTASQADFFTFAVREWLAAEQWLLELRSKRWEVAESWLIYLGVAVLISVKQLGLMFLIAGFSCIFIPIGIIAYKRPKPEQLVVLGMIMVIGLGLLLAVAFL